MTAIRLKPSRHSSARPCRRAGFTLIELSIVLVIIGLLVGGILVGQSLIRQSELRSIVTDIERFKTSVNTYKLKYNGFLPGDNPNCTTFFSSLSQCGNGDGQLSSYASEGLAFWQELGLAGLIAGQYPGWGSNTNIGSGLPASKISGVGYFVVWSSSYGTPANWIYVGSQVAGTPYLMGNAVSSAEAQNIDQKIDDGQPATGSARASNAYLDSIPGYTSGCTTGNALVDPTGAYTNLSGTVTNCYMQFNIER